MKLLVIADEQHLVEMLRAWLKTRGDEVLTASTTAQARQMWEEDHPDLVLLESGLPSADAGTTGCACGGVGRGE